MTLQSGLQLCYAEYGDPSGKPLLYFHGWPSSRLQAKIIHDLCLNLGVRLIAPDRPGMGQSDFQAGRTLRDWPATVKELADHLGLDAFPVMGVSGGGPYALAMAAWAPERVTRTGVVCGAPPLASFQDRSEMMWPYRALMAIRPHAPWALNPILRASGLIAKCPPHRPPLSWVMKWTASEDQQVLMENKAMYDVTLSFKEGISRGLRGVQLEGDIYTADWEMDFTAIKAPVDFWHGTKDRNIPFNMVKEYASWIPTARTFYFDNEGHYSIAVRRAEATITNLMDGTLATGREMTCIP